MRGKASLLISKDSFSLVKCWKTQEPCQTIISRRSPPSIWYSDYEVVPCRSLWKPLLARPSPSKWIKAKQWNQWSPRYRTKRAFPMTNRDWYSLESSWKMAEPCLTTTYRRRLPFTWFSGWEEASDESFYAMFVPRFVCYMISICI